MVTIDDELYGVIMDNITLIMKNFCMTSPYIWPIIEAFAKVAWLTLITYYYEVYYP